MEALLIKNDEWDFVSGASAKSEPIAGNAANATTISDERRQQGQIRHHSLHQRYGAETNQRVQHARSLARINLPV